MNNETENAPVKVYKDYQQRVVDEAGALSEKLDKLTSFLGNLADDMNQTDLDLLYIQKQTMSAYLNVLNVRIKRFN